MKRLKYPNLRCDDPSAPEEDKVWVEVTLKYFLHPKFHILTCEWDGEYRETFLNGKTAKLCYYQMGMVNGDYHLFHLNGNEKYAAIYHLGKKQGMVIARDPEGKVIFNAVYLNNRISQMIEGELLLRHKKSEVVALKAFYHQGRLHGDYLELWPDKRVKITGTFENGVGEVSGNGERIAPETILGWGFQKTD